MFSRKVAYNTLKFNNLARIQSHPVWVRGLKPLFFNLSTQVIESHPVWIRGL